MDIDNKYEWRDRVMEDDKKQKNGSAAGLFFTFFFRGIVIILALVIVGLSAYLVKEIIRGNDLKKKKGTKAAVEKSILTEEKGDDDLISNKQKDEDTTTDENGDNTEEGKKEKVSSANMKIVVLNATEVEGLAGRWTAKLEDAGFTDVSAANSYNKYDTTKILVAEEGLGEDIQEYFPNASISVGTMTSEETDADLTDVKIIVIIGASDSGQ